MTASLGAIAEVTDVELESRPRGFGHDTVSTTLLYASLPLDVPQAPLAPSLWTQDTFRSTWYVSPPMV